MSLLTVQSQELAIIPGRPARQRLAPHSLLVASNGDEASSACVRVAAGIASRRHVPVRVLSVVEPYLLQRNSHPAWKNDGLRHRIDNMSQLVRSQIADYRDSLWTFDIAIGDRLEVISGELRRDDPPWLVMGLNSHALLDRLLKRETTVPITRRAGAPVLCVPAQAPTRFTTAIIGVDLSMPSRSAARAALSLMERGGRAVLAYVHPFVSDGQRASAFAQIVMQSVAGSLERFASDCAARHGMDIEVVITGGDPVEQLASIAEQERASLVAVGALCEPPRSIPPRVRSGLLRIGRWPVLVVPSLDDPLA